MRTQLISCHLPKPIALYYRRRSFTTCAVSSLLRQVSVGESPFAEVPDPGGSQNGSTEMRWYHTSSTVKYSVPPGAWRTTLSPAADFINARPRGDTQLMWLRLRSTSSVPTMLTTRFAPAALA